MNTYAIEIGEAGLEPANITQPEARRVVSTLLQLMCMPGSGYTSNGTIPGGNARSKRIVFGVRERLPAALEPAPAGWTTASNLVMIESVSHDDRFGITSQPVDQPIGNGGDLVVAIHTGQAASTLINVLHFAPIGWDKATTGLAAGILRQSAQDGIYNNPFAGMYAAANTRNGAGRLQTGAVPAQGSMTATTAQVPGRGMGGGPVTIIDRNGRIVRGLTSGR